MQRIIYHKRINDSENDAAPERRESRMKLSEGEWRLGCEGSQLAIM